MSDLSSDQITHEMDQYLAGMEEASKDAVAKTLERMPFGSILAAWECVALAAEAVSERRRPDSDFFALIQANQLFLRLLEWQLARILVEARDNWIRAQGEAT